MQYFWPALRDNQLVTNFGLFESGCFPLEHSAILLASIKRYLVLVTNLVFLRVAIFPWSIINLQYFWPALSDNLSWDKFWSF